jgi:uncharacterized protein YndB with AHSA1/START domain
MEAAQVAIESAEVQSGVSVIIERPPQAVFAALTDVQHHTEWAKGPEEISDVSDQPVRLGSTWQQTAKLLGKKIVAKLQVNEYEENRKFGFGSDKPFPMQFLFTLTPVAEGTEVRMTGSGQPSNIFGKLALPIMVKSVERQMESDLYTLKGILEGQT